MQTRCPHCNKIIPTPTYKQLQAYLLVYIHGMSQRRAAEALGVARNAIYKRLEGFKLCRPDLIPSYAEMTTLRRAIKDARPITYAI